MALEIGDGANFVEWSQYIVVWGLMAEKRNSLHLLNMKPKCLSGEMQHKTNIRVFCRFNIGINKLFIDFRIEIKGRFELLRIN